MDDELDTVNAGFGGNTLPSFSGGLPSFSQNRHVRAPSPAVLTKFHVPLTRKPHPRSTEDAQTPQPVIHAPSFTPESPFFTSLALSEILAAVRFVNASAPITTACRAEVPLNELLSLRAYSSAGWLNHHARHLDRAARAEKALPSSRAHSATVTCVSLVLEPPYAIELGRLQAWLQNIVTARHEDLYRVKGVLSIKGRAERFVLHGIHANVHGAFDRSWSPGELRSSTMVVIGRKLDRAALHEGFRASAVTVDATEVEGACDECAPEETLRRRTPALSYDTQRASQRSN